MAPKTDTEGNEDRRSMMIGVLSDTHGLLRPEALQALRGVDHILHAGDVGDPAILDTLALIAPVTAIRGNVDVAGRCAQLPAIDAVELAGRLFYLIHSVHDLDISPNAAAVAVVVSGHSHKASVEHRGEVIYLNPGSAGPRRFSLPITLAKIVISGAQMEITITDLLP